MAEITIEVPGVDTSIIPLDAPPAETIAGVFDAAERAENAAERAENAAKDVNVFVPAVDDEGNLSWSNKKGLPNPDVVNIKGQQGERGADGKNGLDGKQPL